MVEWKKLGEVCTIERGVRVVRKNLLEIGHIPVFQNSLTPLGYFGKSNYPEHTPFVICAGAAGEIGYSNVPFWAADDCTCVICHSYVISKYVYYYLLVKQHALKSQVRKASVPRLSKNVIEKLLIPIPSLSEQNRIVGILDTFTDSIENLKQQIAQRRKQYEFYRDQLLDNISISTKIGELTKVFSCPRVYKNQWQDSGIPFWRSSDVMSYYNGVKNPRGEVFISQSLYDKLLQKSEKIEKGDILVTGGGSIGIPYLKKDNKPLFVKDADLICIKKCESIIPSFLYHFFFSTSFRLYLKKITHDATIAHYTISQIIETPIPVPPLSEQQRIVSILDTFEASISNLEAQLAQRQKQYEYYRNKLLTFE